MSATPALVAGYRFAVMKYRRKPLIHSLYDHQSDRLEWDFYWGLASGSRRLTAEIGHRVAQVP
jgi:hypothetical protein